ncbi:unnamed protein product [Leptidea sinapis]|uniref:Uncharacterized protein n=1 Tax=Leptidea sinapis TaxID=189913 RepID=A0A5E4QGM8_9NEOP|nr:unnamed protein product [Leptidea sinapis]
MLYFAEKGWNGIKEVAEGGAQTALQRLPLEQEGPDVEQQAVDLRALGVALLARDVHAQGAHGSAHVGAHHRREVAHDEPQGVAAALHVPGRTEHNTN